MKYIVTETQLRTFNKENLNRGKYGETIDKLVLTYLDSNLICDLVTIKIDETNNYVTLILYNGPSPFKLTTKIEQFIKEFIPVNILVMVTDTECRDI